MPITPIEALQRTAIQAGGQQCQAVHGFIQPQALHVRPAVPRLLLAGHSLRIQQRLKAHILCRSLWLHRLQKLAKLKPLPLPGSQPRAL